MNQAFYQSFPGRTTEVEVLDSLKNSYTSCKDCPSKENALQYARDTVRLALRLAVDRIERDLATSRNRGKTS